MEGLGFAGNSGSAFAETKLLRSGFPYGSGSGFTEGWQRCDTYSTWRNNSRVKYFMLLMVMVVMVMVMVVMVMVVMVVVVEVMIEKKGVDRMHAV